MTTLVKTGRIHQINVKPQTPGERGLPKMPSPSAVVTTQGIVGDFNRYRHEKRRDNPNMALLLMPIEMLEQLNKEGWPLKPGDIGENITTTGMLYDSFTSGNCYRVGEVEIQISVKCDPCTNLYGLSYVGESRGPEFVKTMLNRRGWYARVLKEGVIKKGDTITLIPPLVSTQS